MNNSDTHISRQTGSRIGLYAFISVLIVILGFGVYVYRAKLATEKSAYKPVPTDTASTPPPLKKVAAAIKKIDKGAFTIVFGSGASRVPVGRQVSFLVSVNSAEFDIVAYDVLFGYDGTGLSYVGATSSIADFRILPRDAKGYATVTGYKEISSKTQSIFGGDQLFAITFAARKKGKYKVRILPKQGLETTKLIDINKSVVRPKSASIEVEIY